MNLTEVFSVDPGPSPKKSRPFFLWTVDFCGLRALASHHQRSVGPIMTPVTLSSADLRLVKYLIINCRKKPEENTREKNTQEKWAGGGRRGSRRHAKSPSRAVMMALPPSTTPLPKQVTSPPDQLLSAFVDCLADLWSTFFTERMFLDQGTKLHWSRSVRSRTGLIVATRRR